MLFETKISIIMRVKVKTHEQYIGFVIDSKDVTENHKTGNMYVKASDRTYTLYQVIFCNGLKEWYTTYELTSLPKNK